MLASLLSSELLATRADFMAKNMTLTAEQAAKFWPIYEAHQKEHSIIIEEQLKGVQRFVEASDTLDDAGALGLIKAHLGRDERMLALRRRRPSSNGCSRHTRRW